MKKTILTLAIASFFLTVNAQEDRPARGQQREKPSVEQELNQFSDLKLTTEQTNKLKALFEERNANHSQPGQKGDGKKPENTGEQKAKGDKSADFKKQNEEFDAKVKAILTTKQYEQWQKNKANNKPENTKSTGSKQKKQS